MDDLVVFARWYQCEPNLTVNTCFFEPMGVHIPNGISISSAINAYLTAEIRPSRSLLKTAPRHGDLDPILIY